MTWLTPGWSASHAATWLAFSHWRCTRNGSVLIPRSTSHASCGPRFAPDQLVDLVQLAAAGRAGHDHAAQHVAVAAQVLGRAVYDIIRAQPQRPAQIRRRERVVHDQRGAGCVRQLGQRGQIGDLEQRVGDRLDDQRDGRRAGGPSGCEGGLDRGKIGRVHEARGHALACQQPAQQRIGRAVAVLRRHDARPGPRARGQQRAVDGRHARAVGQRRLAALQRGDRRLQRRDGRVAVAGVHRPVERAGEGGVQRLHLIVDITRRVVDRRDDRGEAAVWRRARPHGRRRCG